MKPATSIRSFQRTFQRAFRARHVADSPLPSARPLTLRAFPVSSRLPSTTRLRLHQTYSTSSEPDPPARPLTDRTTTSPEDAASIATRKAQAPAYQLHFTCKKCLEHSRHTVSKQAYHFGTCVVNCPKCKSQHLISDHLKIFADKGVTLEDIAKEHGEKLKKGRLGENGDVEFYGDEAEEGVAKGEEVKS